MRVRELMNRNLVTIGASSSCREALARMHRARVRHLPVLRDDRALVGVVTDRDLRHLLFTAPVDAEPRSTRVETVLENAAVGDVMSSPAITIDSSADVSDAARMMRRGRVGALPVVDGGRLVGIITETDLLREICRADAECSADVTDIVVSYP
jgi:acetoin utilization protein AcuB